MLGVMTIGGTGGSHGHGGSCRIPSPLAEYTGVETGLATCDEESGKMYLKSSNVISGSEKREDVKGIGTRQGLTNSTI